MKTFIVALALLVATVCSGQSTDSYYWYFDKKIPVETALYDVLLISNDQTSLEDVQRWASSNQTIIAVHTTPYKAVRLQLKQDLIKRATFIADLQKTFPQLIVSQSIRFQGSTIGVLNQIILKPKGKDAQAVIERFGSAIKLLRASKYSTYLFEISSTSKCIDLANRIQESGLVEFCQPNFIGGVKLANPLYPDQYYLNNTGQFGGTPGIDINAPEAWAITQGCNNVRVAVIDQGVADHEDMAGRVANGFDPVFPANPGRPLTIDDNHGTACAGIIGASNNTIGIRGVASNATIVPVKIFNGEAAYAASDIADAINWAWDDGDADILSNSWGGPNPDAAITNAINNALTSGRGGLGCIVVAASGNDFPMFNFVNSPASINNVLAVGAIDRNGNIWGYSQRGNGMDLVAPSGNVNLTGDVTTTDRPGTDGYDPGNYTNVFGGTSAACPQVSGAAALILSANPSLTEAQVRTILQQTATDMGATGYDNTFGYGRLNVQAALQAALIINGPNLLCTSATYSVGPGSVAATWSSSNTSVLTINSTTGQATQVGNGYATIYANISTCGGTIQISKNVQVGPPLFAYVAVNGQPTSNATVCVNNFASVEAQPFDATASYTWSLSSSGNAYLTNYYNANTAFNAYSADCYGLTLQISNACGTTQAGLTICAQDCFAPYTVQPNPAKDYLTVAFDKIDNAEALPDEIALLSEASTKPVKMVNVQDAYSQKTFKNGTQIEIDVRDLPRGTYYLHIKNSRRQDKPVDQIRILLE